MLKRQIIKKLYVSTAVLFALLLMYLIPTSNENILKDVKQELSYVNKELDTENIYLLDKNNMLARTKIVVDNKNVTERAKELLEVLIKNGKYEDKIPSGFTAVLPDDTKIISVNYKDNLIKVNFSKELMNDLKNEERIVESIIYTLTSIDDVKKVIIYVDGEILSKLPKSKINLPSTLDRSYGINKQYDLSSYKEVKGVTVYYLNKMNDDYYYVPVTKYVNDDRDKIKIIIEELSSTPLYNTNLMSFLNSNIELLATEQEVDTMFLVFNEYIFSDMDEKNILEEVIYTISLSVADNYDVKEVVFEYENEEIYKSVLKTIE